jgi:hypothetical protein
MHYLLVDLPNDEALSEKFPPSCKVLLISDAGEINTTPTVVKGVKLDLASSDRRSLFALEGIDDPVASEKLLYGPDCPVWFDDNGSKVKGIIRSAFYHPSISEAVYQIQMESGKFIGVSSTKVSFCAEDVRCNLSTPAKAEPIKMDETSDVIPIKKQQQAVIVSPEELPSSQTCEPVESTVAKHETVGIKRQHQEAPASIHLNLPSCLTREQVEGKIVLSVVAQRYMKIRNLTSGMIVS